MKRRAFILGISGAALSASAVCAAGYEAGIVAQLRAQGFDDIKVATTWLGRIRITASKAGAGREIVINPRTGEILRDIVTHLDGSVSPRIGDHTPRTSGSGGSSGNDVSDGEDESDSDHSGNEDSDDSGSNSGSGGSGSSGGEDDGDDSDSKDSDSKDGSRDDD